MPPIRPSGALTRSRGKMVGVLSLFLLAACAPLSAGPRSGSSTPASPAVAPTLISTSPPPTSITSSTSSPTPAVAALPPCPFPPSFRLGRLAFLQEGRVWIRDRPEGPERPLTAESGFTAPPARPRRDVGPGMAWRPALAALRRRGRRLPPPLHLRRGGGLGADGPPARLRRRPGPVAPGRRGPLPPAAPRLRSPGGPGPLPPRPGLGPRWPTAGLRPPPRRHWRRMAAAGTGLDRPR